MKIAYLSPSFMSDVDLSYLSTLHAERPDFTVDYFLQLSPTTLRSAAVNIRQAFPESGVFHADVYPELKVFDALFPSEHTFVVNDLGTKSYSLQTIVAYFDLYRRLKRENYDIIHFTWPLPLAGSILYGLKDRMLMTVHDPFPHSSVRGWLIKRIRQLAFWKVRYFILLNRAQRQAFLDCYRLEDSQIFDSQLSAYTYLCAYRHDTPQAPQPYILFFGQVTPHKGIRYLFEAMKVVHQSHPDVKLVVAGRWKKGYEEPELHDCPDYIEMLPRFIPDEDLANFIADSLFVVTPYLDATQSGVIMSAYAFGKPCIATNVGGLPEMVLHERYGLIVPPRDADAIAEAIIRLLNNPTFCQTLSENITHDYLQGDKSWKKITHELSAYYNKICKENESA